MAFCPYISVFFPKSFWGKSKKLGCHLSWYQIPSKNLKIATLNYIFLQLDYMYSWICNNVFIIKLTNSLGNTKQCEQVNIGFYVCVVTIVLGQRICQWDRNSGVLLVPALVRRWMAGSSLDLILHSTQGLFCSFLTCEFWNDRS